MGDRSDPPSLQKLLMSTDFCLTNAIFTGLRFKVEQATRSLSAIAELLVSIGFWHGIQQKSQTIRYLNWIYICYGPPMK